MALIADNSAGNTVNLDGALDAKTASITAGTSNGAGDDTININQLPVLVPLSVDGGGGTGNALNITGTSGNDTFTITSSEVCIQVGGNAIKSTITYSDIQLMAVNYANPVVTGSQGGNDTFTVERLERRDDPRLRPGRRRPQPARERSEPAGVLNAPVDFVGGAGHNTVNVFGASIGDTIVMADESIQIVQGVSAYVAAVWARASSLPIAIRLKPPSTSTSKPGRAPTPSMSWARSFPRPSTHVREPPPTSIWGAPPAIPVAGGGSVTVPAIEVLADGTTYSTTISGVATTFDSGVDGAIAINGGGSGTTLAIDDSEDSQPEYPVLTATSIYRPRRV